MAPGAYTFSPQSGHRKYRRSLTTQRFPLKLPRQSSLTVRILVLPHDGQTDRGNDRIP
jgi:hypothetical protein